MKYLFNKVLKSRDIILRILLLLLALLAIATFVKPVFSLFSRFADLHITYAYSEEEKYFLKYEEGYVYTTDGCKYQDKDGHFAKCVIEEQDYKIEEGNPVTVFTSDLTGEVIRVQVYTTYYPYYYVSVNTIPQSEWLNYDRNVTEVEYLRAACTLMILLAFFVAVTASVFFTKNTKRRNIYSMLYLLAIPSCILSFISDRISSGVSIFHALIICFLIISSFAYGFISHLLSRRIFLPSLILASSLALLSMTKWTDTVTNPIILIVEFVATPLCMSVLGALLSIICFSLLKYIAKLRDKTIDEIIFFNKIFHTSQELDEKAIGVRAQLTPVIVFFAVTAIPLLYQLSFFPNGDLESLVYVLLLMVVFILHGIFSFWKTKKIILPNLIIIPLCFLISMISYNVRFNATAESFFISSLLYPYLFVIFSLPIQIICFIIIKIMAFFLSLKKARHQARQDNCESES